MARTDLVEHEVRFHESLGPSSSATSSPASSRPTIASADTPIVAARGGGCPALATTAGTISMAIVDLLASAAQRWPSLSCRPDLFPLMASNQPAAMAIML